MQPEKTHLVINDLVAVLSHKETVNKFTLAMINSMIEEGIQAVAYPGQVEVFKNGRRGIIAALTIDLSKDGRMWWNKIGLNSRMLPFCYQQSQELIVKIKTAINNDESKVDGKEFRIPTLPIKVSFPPNETKAVHKLSDKKAKELGEIGLRRLNQFRALARAHAVRRTWKTPQVNSEDVDFIRRIYPYVDYSRPGIL